MNQVVIKTSVWKTILTLLVSLLFVTGGVFLIFAGKTQSAKVVGIISIVFFGFGFFVLLRQGLDRRPRIVIDEEGVTDRTLGVGRINWEDIASVQLSSVYTNKFIVLQLVNTEKYLENLSNASKKMSKINRDLGFGALNLNLSLIDMKPQRVYELIVDRIQKS